MRKDLILAKDYEENRTAKPRKNQEYYRNLSDKEEKETVKKSQQAQMETDESVILPLGNPGELK